MGVDELSVKANFMGVCIFRLECAKYMFALGLMIVLISRGSKRDEDDESYHDSRGRQRYQ